MTRAVTIEMIKDAAARAKANGFELRSWTSHKIAHDLMAYDADFEGADYSQLVNTIEHWRKGFELGPSVLSINGTVIGNVKSATFTPEPRDD